MNSPAHIANTPELFDDDYYDQLIEELYELRYTRQKDYLTGRHYHCERTMRIYYQLKAAKRQHQYYEVIDAVNTRLYKEEKQGKFIHIKRFY